MVCMMFHRAHYLNLSALHQGGMPGCLRYGSGRRNRDHDCGDKHEGLILVVVVDSRPAGSAHQAAAIFVMKGE